MKQLFLCFLLLGTLSPWSFAQKTHKDYHFSEHFLAPEDLPADAPKIEKLLHHIYGHYSNQRLADSLQSSAYLAQECIFIPIWQKKRKGEHWVYFGWFAQGLHEKPLVEGIVLLRQLDRDTFITDIYRAPEVAPLTWQEENPFSDFSPKDLGETPPCQALLYFESDGSINWESTAFCPSTFSEIIKNFKLHTRIKGDKLYSLSSYYNDKGQVIFSYADQPNVFDRLAIPEQKERKRKKK